MPEKTEKRIGSRQGARLRVTDSGGGELRHSSSFAWLLGYLTGGGYVNSEIGLIESTGRKDESLDKFASMGEFVFGKDHFERSYKGSRQVRFYSVVAAREIGHMQADKWSNNIQTRHSWIFDNSQYMFSFLNGAMEGAGSVLIGKIKRINFNTSYREGAELFIKMLLSLGVNRPRVNELRKRGPDRVARVEISNIGDLVLLANKLDIANLDIRKKLISLTTSPHQRSRQVIPDREDVLKEYAAIKRLLGYPPKSTDIRDLRKRGIGKYHIGTYGYWFDGQKNQRGSFVEARKNIEIELAQRDKRSVSEALASLYREPRFKKYHHGFEERRVITEWQRAKELNGGKVPKSSDIIRMHRAGDIGLSLIVFRRFSGNNFRETAERLELIIRTEAGQDVSSALTDIRSESWYKNPRKKHTDEELLRSLVDLKNENEGVLTSGTITRRYKEGRMLVSLSCYINRIGGGSFNSLKDNILQYELSLR